MFDVMTTDVQRNATDADIVSNVSDVASVATQLSVATFTEQARRTFQSLFFAYKKNFTMGNCNKKTSVQVEPSIDRQKASRMISRGTQWSSPDGARHPADMIKALQDEGRPIYCLVFLLFFYHIFSIIAGLTKLGAALI